MEKWWIVGCVAGVAFFSVNPLNSDLDELVVDHGQFVLAYWVKLLLWMWMWNSRGGLFCIRQGGQENYREKDWK